MTRNLVAIDWGTSNLRASLLNAQGQVRQARSTPGGIMAVTAGQHAQVLSQLCGDWFEGGRAVLLASGMIGSRNGWKEAPYLPCPARVEDAARQLTAVDVADGVRLHIAPGLTCRADEGTQGAMQGGMHDVMRGEETQLWGAGLPAGRCCVLPGTHSKWAWMGAAGTVEQFHTYMTGELYGLLTQHGILGRLMEFGHADAPAFDAGVRLGLARHAEATHAIFAARTAGLMGEVAPRGLPDYLSGILIGAEIGSALARRPQSEVTLLGDDALCARYEAALRIAGVGSTRADEGSTTRGLWLLARAAGLLEAP